MRRLFILVSLLVLLAAGATAQGFGDSETGGFVSGALPASEFVLEELTYIFVYPGYDAGTHNDPEFAAAIAGADSIILLDDPAAEFAHIQLARAQPSAALSEINSQMIYRYYNVDTGGSDYYDITSGNNAANNDRRISLYHIAFENFIPPRVPITNAEMHLILNAALATSASDSTYSVLMTEPSDSLWYTSVGVTNPLVSHAAHASWDRQIEYKGTEGYPAAGDTSLWSPTLENRNRFWDWGNTADSRGYNVNPAPDEMNNNLPLINCVQAAVNGEVNNGIAMIHICPTGVNRAMVYYNWETATSNEDNEPWVKVDFLNKKYIPPMPDGGEVAFMFIVDDLQKGIHEAAAGLYRERGGRFTTSIPGVDLHKSDTDTLFVKIDSLVVWHDEGIMEIANHSWYGEALNQYDVVWPDDPYAAATEYTPAMYPTALTGAATSLDSLLYTTDREWLFREFEDFTGKSYRSRHYFAKSLNHPTSAPPPEGFQAIVLQGHVGGRMPIVDLSMTDADDKLDPRVDPASVRGDTIRSGLIPQAMLRPQNLSFFGMTHWVGDFAGADYDTKYYKFRLELEKARANRRGLVSCFAHDTTGINLQGLTAALDAVADTRGAVAISVFDLINQLKSYSRAVATPAAYAQSDTFKYSLDADIWGVLYGKDGVFSPAYGSSSWAP